MIMKIPSFGWEITRNPNQEIRIQDYCFPMDRNFYITKPDLDTDPTWSDIGSLFDIKNIRFKYLPEYSCYTIDLQEKFPNDCSMSHFIMNTKYFMEWLNSLGDRKAREFSTKVVSNLMKKMFI